jgi:hypothetical protein
VHWLRKQFEEGSRKTATVTRVVADSLVYMTTGEVPRFHTIRVEISYKETPGVAGLIRAPVEPFVRNTVEDSSKTLTFGPGEIDGYSGLRLADIGVVPGARVEFEWDEETRIVTKVYVLNAEPDSAVVNPLLISREQDQQHGSSTGASPRQQ